MIHATLHLENGDTDLKLLEFNIPAIIGRSKIADVTIPHPLISRKHCELTEANDGRVAVRDLDSLNGTYVGEVRIKQMMLKPNDLLTVGPYTYRIEYEPVTTEEEQTERLTNGQPQGDPAAINLGSIETGTVYTPSDRSAADPGTDPMQLPEISSDPKAGPTEAIELPELGEEPSNSVSSDDEALQDFFKNLS